MNFRDKLRDYDKTRDVLNRLKEKENEDSKPEKKVLIDFEKEYIEEYNEEDFQTKLKYDTHYFNMLLKNSEEKQIEKVQKILETIVPVVNDLYHLSNLCPKILGFSVRDKMVPLNESEDFLLSEAKKEFMKFLNLNY